MRFPMFNLSLRGLNLISHEISNESLKWNSPLHNIFILGNSVLNLQKIRDLHRVEKDMCTKCENGNDVNIVYIVLSLGYVITARKRGLRWLCFHRCLSVHRGVSAPLHPAIHPSGKTPPWTDTPLGRHPHLGRHPPPAETPPQQCMLGYGQQVSGTHHTRMHSCFNHKNNRGIRFA